VIAFTVQPSFEDYFAANRMVRRKAWAAAKLAKPAISFFVFATLASLLVTVSAGEPWQSQLPVSLVAGIVGAVVWLLVCYGLGELRFGGQVRKAYDQIGTISLPTTFRFDDAGMEAEYQEGSSRHDWTRFTDYMLDDCVLMLRRSDLLFFLVPLDQVDAEQRNQLVALLERVGVKRA